MNNLKVIFMGTPEFSLPVLEGLNSKYNVVMVVCQPDKPSNRGVVQYSPVKDFAIKNNIKVFQPVNVKNEYHEILSEKPDLIVTCAYGQIIPKEILDYPKYGCINVHASLLPKLRGGAPIHRAIIEGHKETGITIMKMKEKMDAGDIISQVKTEILDDDTVGTLHDKLSVLARDLLLSTIPNIISGNINLVRQNEEEATFAWNIKREDEKIDFSKTTREIYNQIRGLNPWPGAYAILSGRIIKIWASRYGDKFFNEEVLNGQIVELYKDGIGVKTSNGEIIITELQLEGKRRMLANEFMNGVVNKELLVGRMFE
jgi:methionyl-tRNA formyltransferase